MCARVCVCVCVGGDYFELGQTDEDFMLLNDFKN